MSTASVALSRTTLALDPLTINDSIDATYTLTPDGLGVPGVTWRITYMPDSPYIHGSEAIAAAKATSSLPLTVTVKAASASALRDAVRALGDALDQFTYTATITLDGLAETWSCDPASYSQGPVLAEELDQFLTTLTVTIPVYPIPN